MTEPFPRRASLSLVELRSALLAWYLRHRRDLPWRRTSDPYAIWISETMLQQTRVSAVIPYYGRFLERFPDVASLAAAPEGDLLAAWSGLGYYYRARNLQQAARAIASRGTFPGTYPEILALPGVGPYTAAAVSSIAFHQPHAVLDGNVFRVLSRLYNDRTDIASSAARQHFSAKAAELLDHDSPGDFNQAIMELGATVCLPKRPQCLLCPLAPYCQAHRDSDPSTLPVKIKPARSLPEHRRLLWIERDGAVLSWQRPPGERLMPGFWELPEAVHLPDADPVSLMAKFRHAITVHDYRFELWTARLPESVDPGSCSWLSPEDLTQLPLSTIFRKAMQARQRKIRPAAE